MEEKRKHRDLESYLTDELSASASGHSENDDKDIPSLGVTLREKRLVVSSRDVARIFEKNHRDVLRSIRELGCSEDFRLRNFAQSSQIVETGNGTQRNFPEYLMTRDGLTILVMGYTGSNAMRFKEAYIAEFNRMEDELRGRGDGGYTELRQAVEAQGEMIHALAASITTLTDTIKSVITPPREKPLRHKALGLSRKEQQTNIYNITVTLQRGTRSFSPEALDWMVKTRLEEPDVPAISIFEALVEEAEDNGWQVGSQASFYRLLKKLLATMDTTRVRR